MKGTAALGLREERGARLLLAAAVLAAFSAGLALPFIYDDFPLLRDNPGLASARALLQLAGPLYYRQFGVGNYHPLPILLWWVARRLFGPVPAPFHVLNLAFHLANSLLAFRLSLLLFGREDARAVPRALAAALLWAASPLHCQAVFVGAFLPDLACAFFCLAALIAALEPGGRIDGWRPLLLFSAGLLSKETAAVLPLVLAALSPRPRKALGLLGGYLCVLTAYAAFRLTALNDLEMLASGAPGPGEPWYEPAVRAVEAVRLIVWPRPLVLIRSSPGASVFLSPGAWLAGACLASAAWAAVRVGRGPLASRAGAWLALWLLPFLNLVPLAYSRQYFEGRFLNDRYLYLASLGFFWLLVSLPVRKAAGRLAASAALLLSLAACWGQARLYAEPLGYWRRNTDLSPSSLWARDILGVAELYAGSPDEARRQFEAALRLRRGSAFERSVTFANLGAALFKLGLGDEAGRAYRHALTTDPSNEEARRFLGPLEVPGRGARAAPASR